MERKQTTDSLESISKACDEAEDLLAALDESDQQKKADDQTQNIPIEQSNTSITKIKTTNEGAVGCLTILGIGIAGVIFAELTNQNGKTELQAAMRHKPNTQGQWQWQEMPY